MRQEEKQRYIYIHRRGRPSCKNTCIHATLIGTSARDMDAENQEEQKEEDGAKGRGRNMQRKLQTYAHMPGNRKPSMPFLMSSDAPEKPSRMSWKSKACVGAGRQTSRREGSRRKRGTVTLLALDRAGALRLCDGAIVVDNQKLYLCG